MNMLQFQFLPLTFINTPEEIKRQIKNTIIFRYIFNKYNTTLKLNELIINSQYGYNAPAQEFGKNRYLRISDIKDGKVEWSKVPFCDCDEESKYLLKQGDILIARTGGTTGKSFLIENVPTNAVYAGYLIRIRHNDNYDPRYIYSFLNSYAYWAQIADLKIGSAQPNVNAEKLKSLNIPVCPKEVQNQIIEYVYEDKVCDSVKEIDILVNNIIRKFDKYEESKNLYNNQIMLLAHLKQIILNEALQNNDNIHESIKQNSLSSSINESINFPQMKWKKAKLGEVIDIKRGASPRPIKAYLTETNEGINWIKISDANNGKYIYQTKEKITKQGATMSVFVNKGDLIMSNSMSFGKPRILDIDGCIHDGWLVFQFNHKIFDKDFLYFYLLSQQDYYESKASGTGVRNLNINKVAEMDIKIPSLVEQKEIVKKIEHLMDIYEELELKIIESQKSAELLMRAVLQEAFNN